MTRPSKLLLSLAFLSTAGAAQALAQGSGREVPAPAVPDVQTADEDGPRVRQGETLDPSTFGPFVIETMADVVARQELEGLDNAPNPKARNGAHGEWEVPGKRWAKYPHSGSKYVINRWGDTRLGIGFGGAVDLRGAWIGAQGTPGSWTEGVMAIGFRNGAEVARTDWFTQIGEQPAWFAVDLAGVDRVEFVSRAMLQGSGWYGLDDLTFTRAGADGQARETVLDFEDLSFDTKLFGSQYGGLTWERGSGDFSQDARIVPAPQVASGPVDPTLDTDDAPKTFGGSGTSPLLVSEFIGAKFGDTGANLIPPDTCGAVGITHFMSGVNSNFSVFVKATGLRVLNVGINSFWSTSGLGDPRVVYDPANDRFAVIASNFSNRIYFAYSLTGDPTGAWFKTSILVSQGSDAGKWPDYPTLGVDQNGVYTAAYMVGSGNPMSIFAVDKAPLLSGTPTMGTVTAFRNLPWEGAIQPAVTWGNSGGEYLISRRNSTQMRVRQITGPMTAPTLVEVGSPSVTSSSTPPAATQQGTSATLDTLDGRPMNSVWRNGSLWMAHAINASGRSGVRWYEIGTSPLTVKQTGNVTDTSLHYYAPSISVSSANEMLLGFTGSGPAAFCGAYMTGRLPTDPTNETGAPVLYKAGEAPYTQLTSSGNNRWGDYSLTSTDPVDDSFWTIQQYARVGNSWVTRIANGDFGSSCAVATYCTSKVSTNLCIPSITSIGTSTASVSNPAGFVLSTANLERNTIALNFWSATGQASTVFQGGFLCVATPVYRMPAKNTGGAVVCAGTLTYSLADYLAHPQGPSHIFAGANITSQTWGRDPADAFGTSLSDAIQFVVCP